jgi:opine dehydrogenase
MVPCTRKFVTDMRIAVLGAGAGGAAAVVELSAAGHQVALWGRSPSTLAPFRAQAGIAFDGVFGVGLAKPDLITDDIAAALEGAEVALVCLPTTAHDDLARRIANAAVTVPIVLNPGHTGGALEFAQVFRTLQKPAPPIAEFSTLSYVARKYSPGSVMVTGAARFLRLGWLPGGEAAADVAQALFPSAERMRDVLACDLANLNMVLHVPGAVLGAAWVEATGGDFTFYVQGITPGVTRVMRTLDDERRAVAKAFGHDLPSVTAEMQEVGTVEASANIDDFAGAISSGEANKKIKAPNALSHRYYLEDFGHGLLPFIALAECARVAVPVASSLLRIGQTLLGDDFLKQGRTAARMGIAGLDRDGLLKRVAMT